MKSRSDFFITGTDTGVGKTMVTAALLTALRDGGVDAVAMKPVQTGADNERSPDLDFCAKAAKWKIPADDYDTLCPFRFPLPASPHLAARVARKRIVPEPIIAAFERLRRNHEAVLVEGAGGLLVPLCDDFDQRDLIVRLDLDVIVVARPGLGTLNHTRLTVEALRNRSIHIAGIVLSNVQRVADSIEKENVKYLREMLSPLPVLPLPGLRRGEFVAQGRRLLRGLGLG